MTEKNPKRPSVGHLSTSDEGTANRPYTRRRRRRTETRRRLVEAAIKLIREEGADRLTTTRVTAKAGIVQSGFYLYFPSIDECKRAAAEQVAADVQKFITDHRRRAGPESESDPEVVHEHYEAMLRLFLYERQFAELLLRYRHDPSPLGEVLRELSSQLRQDLIDDLRKLVRRFAPDREDDRRLAIYADIVTGMVWALGEGMLEGRYDAPEPLAQELTLVSFAIARTALAGDSG